MSADIEIIARWYVGLLDVDQHGLDAAIATLDPFDEDVVMGLGRAVAAATKEYRRIHGEWPAYRPWPW